MGVFLRLLLNGLKVVLEKKHSADEWMLHLENRRRRMGVKNLAAEAAVLTGFTRRPIWLRRLIPCRCIDGF